MELREILAETTGRVAQSTDEAGMKFVDVVFFTVMVNEMHAEHHRQNFIDFLDTLPAEVMANGPSYIGLGGLVGDQGVAFEMMALGEVLGLWKIITPHNLGVTEDEQTKELAGMGLVMISGYRKS